MKFLARYRDPFCLLLFAAVFITLAVSSYVRESATWDEPQHLVAGYSALKFHDYRTDPEHPPFIRMWAALPLLAMDGIKFDSHQADPINPTAWVMGRQFFFCHDTLYVENDADHLLYAARFMIVLLGVLLGVLLFCWAGELFGFSVAAIVLGLYTIEPNILAHARLVTTDFGVACFVFGTLYFLWRTARRLSVGNLCGLAGFFVLTYVSKYSAVLLGPIVLALLVVRVCQPRPWATDFGGRTPLTGWRQKGVVALAIFVVLAALAWAGIWAVYDFRYLPSDMPGWRMEFSEEAGVRERTPVITEAVAWVEAHRLLPNAYSQGLLLTQVKAQKRSSFLAGNYSTEGWWWFFPFAFLIKTPIAVELLFVIGVVLSAVRWRRFLDDAAYAFLPIAGFVGAAITAKLNIGARHILPIYPFVLLLAGFAVEELCVEGRKMFRGLLVALCLLAVLEFALVCPHYLAFFNQFAGGPREGHKYLVDSSLDWGQDLKGLKRWMDSHNVAHINLSYFGTADPAYYHINCTYLPGGPFYDDPLVSGPTLPGFVAVSVTNLRGVYFTEQMRGIYKPLLDTKPAAVIGYSIYVYWIERPWWQ